MALIPLKQTVLQVTASGEDDYGYPVESPPITLKCRFDERSDVVRTPNGDEVTTLGRFHFDKAVQVAYGDTLRYTDDFGNTTDYQPKLIAPIRGLNGKRVLLRVDV